MKELTSICTFLLLISASALADDHIVAALKHANEAVAHGKEGHMPILIEHSKAALAQALAASMTAKGASKIHLDAAVIELQEVIDHCELGHIGAATKHAQTAAGHLKVSNE